MKAFLLYQNQKALIEELSIEERGILLTALFEYQETGNVIEMGQACRIVFKTIANQIKIDEQKYENKCNKNKENAIKRWQKYTSTAITPSTEAGINPPPPPPPESYDITCNNNIEKVFNAYRELCPDLKPIKYERRNRDTLDLVARFLVETNNDFEYLKDVCKKANMLKVIGDYALDFKGVIRNHISISNEKFKKGGDSLGNKLKFK